MHFIVSIVSLFMSYKKHEMQTLGKRNTKLLSLPIVVTPMEILA